MPRPRQRTPELRERVLRTALDLLNDGDVRGLTTREVAQRAGTSPPAIYELFGDKSGLVREIFLEGFRRLDAAFSALPEGRDAMADAKALIHAFREFAKQEPRLVEVMFARPFADFRPGPKDVMAAVGIHDIVIARVERCIAAGVLEGDSTDVAHALMAMSQGLAAAERAGRLGSSPDSIERRWSLAIDALFAGLAPDPSSEEGG